MNVESRLLGVVSSYGGQQIISSPSMTEMVRRLASEAEQMAREGWLPASEWVPNDIEATGRCCCGGCIGEGPCDLDAGQPGEGDEGDCLMCPADCQICSDTPNCDCPTHGGDHG